MPALSAPVSSFITSVTNALTVGSDLGQNIRGAAQNYVRAQDMSTVIELLGEAMLPTTAVACASNGSTTTAVITSSMIVNFYKGATITFASNTTTALLRGVSRTIVSNTATTITVATLPAATATGDTFTVTGNIFLPFALEIRENKERGYPPVSTPYGLSRTLANTFVYLSEKMGYTKVYPTISRPGAVTGTGSTTTQVVVGDPTLQIDSMKGYELVIAGQTREILGNTESTLVLNAPITAPASGVSYTIRRNTNQINQNRKHTVHPGGHPDNATLAQSINELRAAVVAATVPA